MASIGGAPNSYPLSAITIDADLNMGSRKITAKDIVAWNQINADVIYEYTVNAGTALPRRNYYVGFELLIIPELLISLAGTWMEERGDAISRTAYASLFARIGTRFGAGDGSTTFNIPDMRGRSPIGLNSADSDFNTEGKTYGEKKHTPIVSEMANHAHSVPGGTAGPGSVLYKYTTTSTGDVSTSAEGGGNPFNVVHPVLVRRWYIRVA